MFGLGSEVLEGKPSFVLNGHQLSYVILLHLWAGMIHYTAVNRT
jgi:hypothetical protein